jgi:glycosyltransferase involved in cell wall biosynthesis
MRVVYVSSLSGGGPISHLRNLLPHVAAAGVDVHLVCRSEVVRRSFEEAGIEGTVAPLRHKLDIRGAARLRTLLRGDVVHTHDRRAGLLARPQAPLVGAHAVHTLHGLPEEIAPSVGRPDLTVLPGVSRARLAWLLHGYLRIEAVLARFGTVVAPSEALARFLVAHGLPAARVRVVPSGIELRRREPSPAHEPFVVATIARLEYWKGIDVLLEACARVSAPLRLEIFGEGTERTSLERQAARLGLDACFHGEVERAWERLDELDLLALPSRAENLPIVVLEAMAGALPIVATRVGGVDELVLDGENGYLVEPEDATSLAAAIERIASDSGLRDRLGRRSAQLVSERFDARRAAERLVALYEEVCSGRDGG